MSQNKPVRTMSSSALRLVKKQVIGLGICLSLGGSAFGQGQLGFGTTGQTGIGQQMGGLGQIGQLGQTSQLGGQTGGFGQTTGQTGLGGGVGQNSSISQLGSPALANAFGSGGIMGANTSSAFGGLANAAILGRSLNGGMGGGMNGMGGMNAMGGMGGGMGGRGGMQGGRGFNSMNQNQNGNKPQVRATVKLGFDVAPRSNSASSQIVNTRLNRVPSPVLKGVNVEMNGRTAVLRGNVATLAEAKVVERYLSLEPGIDAVKNELTIASGEKLAPRAASNKTSKAAKRQSSASAEASSDSAGDSTVQAASPELVPAPGPQ